MKWFRTQRNRKAIKELEFIIEFIEPIKNRYYKNHYDILAYIQGGIRIRLEELKR